MSLPSFFLLPCFGFRISDFGFPPLAALHLDGVDHSWLWLLLVAAGGWALFEIYRGIFQRTERRLTWWLMALRGAGLLALVFSLAKPSWVRRSELVEPGRLAVVLDNSRSMSLADASGKPRYALARDAVARIQHEVAATRGGPQVAATLFDINGEPLADGAPAEPRVDRTDLARALAQTTARLRSEPLVGIVLVSDGVDNTGRDQILAGESATVPIYTVGFREDTAASRLDLALTRVDAPKRVLVNNTVKVTVLVEKSAGPATTATVVVRRGRDQFASQEVRLPAGHVQQSVGLTMTPTEAGNFVYTAAVSAEAGERLLANNLRQFPLQVDADAIRVFYVEGFLRYEYKFLKNRLENDPDISLVAVVRRANPERAPTESGGELITPERLKNFEVVILGDMEGDYLTTAEYRALVEWISAGHSLLVLGGYRSFGPTGFRATPLADALPVTFLEDGPLQSEDPFVLELTEAGRRHPVFELTGDRVQDASLWSSAPSLLGSCLVRDIKPGAEILAVNPTATRDDHPMPVVVIQRFGTGHTMLLGVDTTWRWSRLTRVFGQSDTLFARFWSQTIRWLAGRDPEKNRPPLIVSTDRPDYEVGKPVTVRVVRQHTAPPPPASSPSSPPSPAANDAQPPVSRDTPGSSPTAGAGEVSVEVTGEDGRAVPVQMSTRSAEPDVYTGTIYPPAGGRYTVSASLAAEGKLVANQAADFLVHGSDLELADPRTNRALLQSLAAASGGLYLDIADADQVAAKIDRKDRRLVRVQRAEFWNSPWLFLFFLGAVTTEWVIRRRNHLV